MNSPTDWGLVGPRCARLSVATTQKHKHLMTAWCLCFRIVVTLMTPAEGRRPTSPSA